MEIRSGTESDIPAIVQLLKLSLGESLMPKSEAFWRWKHMDNPFGPSPVLVAYEGSELIGVRAFMRWEWRQGEKIWKAVRAVDTATHPAWQGKGIFTQLTKALVDDCRREGIHFIFNTPNEKSRPGYLKMGWYSIGRLKLGLLPVLPARLHIPESDIQLKNINWDKLNRKDYPENLLVTNDKPGYWYWRYACNPNIRYCVEGDEQTGYFIYRLRKHRLGTEFRITDVILTSQAELKNLRRRALRKAGAQGAHWITWAGVPPLFGKPLLPVGPVVTLNRLNFVEDLNFSSLCPSLGDLEVF